MATTKTNEKTIAKKASAKIAENGLKIKSLVSSWSDWSTSDIRNKEARAAAEWIITNGFEQEKSVQSAFYDRQTSSMSDDPNAEKNDEKKIIGVAEKLGMKINENTKFSQAAAQAENAYKENELGGTVWERLKSDCGQGLFKAEGKEQYLVMPLNEKDIGTSYSFTEKNLRLKFNEGFSHLSKSRGNLLNVDALCGSLSLLNSHADGEKKLWDNAGINYKNASNLNTTWKKNVFYDSDSKKMSRNIGAWFKEHEKIYDETVRKDIADKKAAKEVTAAAQESSKQSYNRFDLERLEKNVPQEMKELKQWVVYFTAPDKDIPGKLKKIMIDPNTVVDGKGGSWAKPTEPSTWVSFEKAMETAKTGNFKGLAFALTKESGITCFDLDKAIDPSNGHRSDLAWEFVNKNKFTYKEKSVSEMGLHVFLKGNLPEGTRNKNEALGLEAYDDKRFMCMTGMSIAAKYKTKSGEVIDYDAKKLSVYNEYTQELVDKHLGKKLESEILATTEKSVGENGEKFDITAPRGFSNESDRELIDKIMNSKNGAEFKRLYEGDTSAFASQSQADWRLCGTLAYWTRCDAGQMDSIFRTSGLMRPKWDEKHGAMTYGQQTIQKSIALTKNVRELPKTVSASSNQTAMTKPATASKNVAEVI